MRYDTVYSILIFLIVLSLNSACDYSDPLGHNKDSLRSASITSSEYSDTPLSTKAIELQVSDKILPILEYPKDADKIAEVRMRFLTKTLPLVPSINALNKILDNMWASLYNFNLKFLSADQIGLNEFIVVIDMDASRNKFLPPNIGRKKIVMIYPKVILASSKAWEEVTETCVSVPKLKMPITRRKIIVVSFYNEKYIQKIISADKELSYIIQHAVDHLYHNKCVIDLPGS